MTTDAALREQAELHASQQDWDKATAAFEALLVRRPGDADVLLQLSYVASLAGRYRAARAYAVAAAGAAPRDVEQVRELLSRLRTFNEIPALQASLDRLKPLSRMTVPLLLTFAAQFSHLNLQAAALELLDEAKRRDPNFPPTLASRAQVLIYLGRFDDAEADLLACLRAAPGFARPWGLLAGLRKQTASSNVVPGLRRELARPQRHAEDLAELGFALHKCLDDIGDHAGAWAALEQACRAKRGLLQYRSQDSVDLVDALLQSPVLPLATAGGTRVPIFIVGMHRSGTTLLEQFLSGHSGVQGLGELYDFTGQMRQATDHHCRGVIDTTLVQRAAHGVDFGAVGRGYLDSIAWRLGPQRHFTDKLPSNFLNIGFICRALPQARILHMRRDPMETCFSNLRELFSEANPYSYDQRELGAFHGQYTRLMAHWHAAFPGRILDIEHAALVAAPEATLRGIAAFCGLDFQPSMLNLQAQGRAVNTASAVAVRQGLVVQQTPKWLPYARQLQPLADALAQPGAAATG